MFCFCEARSKEKKWCREPSLLGSGLLGVLASFLLQAFSFLLHRSSPSTPRNAWSNTLVVRDLTALLWAPLMALSETHSSFLQRDFRLFSTFYSRNGGCLECEPTQHQLDAKNSSLSACHGVREWLLHCWRSAPASLGVRFLGPCSDELPSLSSVCVITSGSWQVLVRPLEGVEWFR